MKENELEELFCIKFELDTLSEVTLKNEAERWIPGFIHEITEHDHVQRYHLAAEYTKGRSVLDFACGAGKGSFILATKGEAKHVTGCDIETNSIRYAKHRNCQDNIEFEVQDAEKYRNENYFDIVISFETIEHLKNYKAFLENIKISLKPGGIFIVSTPISAKSLDLKPHNPYHIQEWGYLEFQSLLSEYFVIEKKYLQLYQNSFLNKGVEEKNAALISNFRNKRSLVTKIKHRLFKINEVGPATIPYYTEWNNKNNFSKIFEDKGLIDPSQLGSEYIGYQITVCTIE